LNLASGVIALMTRKRPIALKGTRRAKGNKNSDKSLTREYSGLGGGEESLARIGSAAGIILAVTENRNWIEVFFEGDLMHTRTVNLPAGTLFNIYVEEIPHKTTVYEHPRTMIFFDGPCDIEITRDGDKVIIMGVSPSQDVA
jgi:hypothetical protein